MVAFYCLMSVFKRVCHLPSNNGFSSLVSRELELHCTDSVNKRTDTGEAVGGEPAHRLQAAPQLPHCSDGGLAPGWGFQTAPGSRAEGRGVGGQRSLPARSSFSFGSRAPVVWEFLGQALPASWR